MFDLEEPVGHEPAAAFYFVAKIASQWVKVALSGRARMNLGPGTIATRA